MLANKMMVATAVVSMGLSGGAYTVGANAQPDTRQIAVEVDLDFRDQQEIVEILVQEGEQVKKGQALARIDDGEARSGLAAAQASLAAANANLDKVRAGATEAERAQAKVPVERADNELRSSGRARHTAGQLAGLSTAKLEAALRHATAKVAAARAAAAQNEVVRQAAVDQAGARVAQSESEVQGLEAALSGARQALAGAQAAYDHARARLAASEADYARKGCTPESTDAGCQALGRRIDEERGQLEATKGDRDAAAQTVDQLARQLNEAQQGLRQERASFTTALNEQASGRLADRQGVDRAVEEQTNAALDLSSGNADNQRQLDEAADKVDGAALDKKAAEADYAVNTEAPTPSDVTGARAQVAEAQAAVDKAEDIVARTVLRAPADGTITAIRSEVGETAGTGGGGGDAGSGGGANADGGDAGGGSGASSAFMTLMVVKEL